MIALGQFRDTFIIAMDDEGLCIIDQHVAHERVLFERIMERLTTESLESQRLLIPVVMELPAAERAGRRPDRRCAEGSICRPPARRTCPTRSSSTLPPTSRRGRSTQSRHGTR